MVKKYLPRVADEVLDFKLSIKGAVLIEGPKWCGKSTTAEKAAASTVYMQNPATREQNVMLSKVMPNRILEGKTPRLIDEWQIAPALWDAVRFEVDQRGEFGQFILTGSVTPPSSDEITHSGTGRITRMRMRPMTLFESKDSSGEVSLKNLFEEEKTPVSGTSDKTIEDLAYLMCRGGWPQAVGQKPAIALQQAADYFEDLVNTDFSKVDGIRRQSSRMARLLRSYARNIASEASFTTIRDDIKANEPSGLSEDTVASYVSVLEKLFVIDEIRAWQPNLRSKTSIRTTNTRHFVDPSIGAAAMSMGPNDFINDLNTFGLFFESMAIRDLRVYAQRLQGEVFHYRNKRGEEVDAVIHLRDGRYGLIEVKLFSEERIEEGAQTLLSVSKDIDQERMKRPPSFLMVVTGTPYAYRREDGVIVAPLATLAP